MNRVSSNTRISVHNKAGSSIDSVLLRRKVRQVDGVEAAVATMCSAAPSRRREVTSRTSRRAEHIGAVYPDYNVPAAQLADFQRYRDGAIVGARR